MTLWDLDDLASLMDIAREHGLSISTVFTWEVRYPEFPEPLAMLAGANIYSRTAVRKWMNTPRSMIILTIMLSKIHKIMSFIIKFL